MGSPWRDSETVITIRCMQRRMPTTHEHTFSVHTQRNVHRRESCKTGHGMIHTLCIAPCHNVPRCMYEIIRWRYCDGSCLGGATQRAQDAANDIHN
eukprot:scaffold314555_cov33-Tisochrysis_lutea.AAC.3